jgi:gliding motility-associated-like protein
LPALINTGTIGSTIYTFTPAAGQCAVTTTMTIQITAPNIVPTFTQIAPICQGTTAPNLPNPSTNNPTITGTWSPATINTGTIGSTIYTFTPAADQCAVITTMTIQITAPNIVPTFNQIAPICQGTTAPNLPNPSTNNPTITGAWSPATINTGTIGNTTYTFTPAVGQCAVTTTMTIQITAPTNQTLFTQISPICQGDIAPILNNVSNNLVQGSWSPAEINTDLIGSSTYVFTPNANQCASIFNMVVQITAPVNIPLFAQIAPICQGNSTQLLLPTSTNLITGIWSPSTINTSNAGTTIYTFTPTVGQCAQTQTMAVQIIFRDTPTFNPIVTSICKKELNVPVLQTTSTNGITGTWSPSSIVSSALVGEVTYTFTPNATFCATKPTIKITTFDPTITPLFDNVSRSICAGGSIPTLPNVSQNGISGAWSPGIVNATSTGTYTFTSNAGQCAKDLTITINYVPKILSEIKSECINANFTLTVDSIGNSFNPNNTYVWKDETGFVISNANSTSLNVTNYSESTVRVESLPITYSVEITTPEGCKSSQSFKIDNIYCGIQKGISPNNDTKNDFFDLTNFDVKEFSIFNRYGTKVYLKAGYKNEWFGQTDSGEILPDGTYFYNIEFANNEMKTGWVYINKETN